LDDRGSIPGSGKEGISSFLRRVQTDFGVHLALCQMGSTGCFPGCEAEHSPLSSAAVSPFLHTSSWCGA